jgi:hypothetical protein
VSEFGQLVIATLGYRCVLVGVGLALSYMGFRLFCLGLYEKVGELKASWGGRALVLRQAAPGTFFVVCGGVVLLGTLARGVQFDKEIEGSRAHLSDASRKPLVSTSTTDLPASAYDSRPRDSPAAMAASDSSARIKVSSAELQQLKLRINELETEIATLKTKRFERISAEKVQVEHRPVVKQ